MYLIFSAFATITIRLFSSLRCGPDTFKGFQQLKQYWMVQIHLYTHISVYADYLVRLTHDQGHEYAAY